MRLEDFHYELPEDRIAKTPVEPRDHSRLMVVDKETGQRRHRRFFEIADELLAGDLLVLNNTKVFPARLFGHDAKGRRFEVFLLKPHEGGTWSCLARPGKKIRPDELVELAFPEGVVGHIRRTGDEFAIRFSFPGDFFEWLERAGEPPLPPYLKRAATQHDRERYQTVFAKERGSVAAPTAGLHFTEQLLEKLRAKGIETIEVTLHVGYGTFAPVQAENLEDHKMHEELFHVPAHAFHRLEAAKREGRRIIAVGTTSLRALESIPRYGLTGSTDLFIYPGYRFHWVDGLITNFHLPQSTLYILVAALLGTAETRTCYEEAIREGYRFYSYGDAMAILPFHHTPSL